MAFYLYKTIESKWFIKNKDYVYSMFGIDTSIPYYTFTTRLKH